LTQKNIINDLYVCEKIAEKLIGANTPEERASGIRWLTK